MIARVFRRGAVVSAGLSGVFVLGGCARFFGYTTERDVVLLAATLPNIHEQAVAQPVTDRVADLIGIGRVSKPEAE